MYERDDAFVRRGGAQYNTQERYLRSSQKVTAWGWDRDSDRGFRTLLNPRSVSSKGTS